MDEQTKGFRSAVFGGFRREDVLRYIEETDAKYYEESERLRSSLDDAQTAMGELRGQNAACVVVVEQLAAELQVQLAAEMRDALLDVRRLGCNVLFVVKTDFFHVPFIPP